MWFKKKEIIEKKGILESYDDKRHNYYFDIIKSMSNGANMQFTTVIVLKKVSYGYYQLGDVIVWFDDRMHKALLEVDIASYNDSSKNLIITTDKDRLASYKN